MSQKIWDRAENIVNAKNNAMREMQKPFILTANMKVYKKKQILITHLLHTNMASNWE